MCIGEGGGRGRGRQYLFLINEKIWSVVFVEFVFTNTRGDSEYFAPLKIRFIISLPSPFN